MRARCWLLRLSLAAGIHHTFDRMRYWDVDALIVTVDGLGFGRRLLDNTSRTWTEQPQSGCRRDEHFLVVDCCNIVVCWFSCVFIEIYWGWRSFDWLDWRCRWTFLRCLIIRRCRRPLRPKQTERKREEMVVGDSPVRRTSMSAHSLPKTLTKERHIYNRTTAGWMADEDNAQWRRMIWRWWMLFDIWIFVFGFIRPTYF